MSFLTSIWTELRERKLWPLPLVLIAALVAVPIALSKNPSPAPVAKSPAAGLPVSGGSVLPITVNNAPSNSHLTGRSRDPFTQQRLPSTTTSSSTTSTTSASTASGTSSTSGGTGVATTPTTTTPTTPTTTTPTTITPGATPKPAPTGLTATESYHVTLAITNPAGGLDAIDPLKRLTVLPNDQQHLLVELGVLKGGKRVLFAVQPRTVVTGPGTCTPGPIDCEILSLAQDQTESLSRQSPSGVAPVALFAVTAITADKHQSAAAADKARRTASAAGRDLLSKSTLSALSLFQYEPSLGVVVDLRNLTVGGG
jgi:hypothetical protein